MRLGDYEVGEVIGKGGAGVVVRGRSPRGDHVAIKLIRPSRAGDEGVQARFLREMRLLASLGETDGFVPLLDMGEHEEHGCYIVMPFLGGGTLADRLRKGPLGVAETLGIARAVARALGHAHSRGIVHRDVKPGNVLFTASGTPLVSDLGLAKHFRLDVSGGSQSVSLSAHGDARGTIGYMAPEQLESSREVGPAADVFSLGVLVHECLTGTLPYPGDDRIEYATHLANGTKAPSLEKLVPGVPRALAAAVLRSLEIDPKRRFSDAVELGRALGAASEEKAKSRSARYALVGLAALASVLALATLVAAVLRPQPLPPTPPPPPPHSTPVGLGSWIPRAPMPVGVFEFAAVATSRGKIYAMGGRVVKGGETKNQEYDIATDTWTLRKDLPRARLYGSVVELGGKLYVAGGTDGAQTGSLAELDCYDPELDAWEELPDAPAPLPGSELYVDGGKIVRFSQASDKSPLTIQTYDPSRRSWDSRPARASFPLEGFFGARVPDGLIAFKPNLGIGWIPFPPDPRRLINFSPTAVIPVNAGAAALGGRVYVAGGFESRADKTILPTNALWSVEAHEPFGDFHRHAPLAKPRRLLSLVAARGKLYALGGLYDPDLKAASAVEEFTP